MPEQTQAEKFAQAAAQAYPPPPGRGWKYYAKRAAIYLAAGYVILCGCFFYFQKRIVYRPAVSGELAVTQCGFGPAQGRDVEIQTSDGVTLSGWRLSANAKSFKKLSNAPLVVLYFGANDGNRSARENRFWRLLSMGADVVCFDYRGFGDSEGNPTEDGLAHDARAAWNYLSKEGVAPAAIVFYGESLGGAVALKLAADLSAEKTPPAGVVVESSFSKFSDMEGKLYPFLPVSLLLTQRYKSIEKIASVESALLMIHGQRDTTAPISSARALFEAAPARSAGNPGVEKKFVELAACGHDDVGEENAVEYDEAVNAFFKTLCPSLTSPAQHFAGQKKTMGNRIPKDGTLPKKKLLKPKEPPPVVPP